MESLVSQPSCLSLKCACIYTQKYMCVCVCVLRCTVRAPCGLAAAAAWPESRSPVQCLWECGEFGWDQLIKHCTLALSCFPCRQGSSDQRGSHTGGQRQELLSTAAFFGPTHAATQLTRGSRPLASDRHGDVSLVNSFTSPERRRTDLLCKLFLPCHPKNRFYASVVWFCNRLYGFISLATCCNRLQHEISVWYQGC